MGAVPAGVLDRDPSRGGPAAREQRAVFRFHYFADMPQSEIARLMDLHPRQVSRLWLAATMRLADRLSGLEELNA